MRPLSWMRKRSTLAVLAAIAAIAGVVLLTVPGSGGDRQGTARFRPPLDPATLGKPPRPLLHSGGAPPVVAERSTWCWTAPGRDAGSCADYAYEPPRGRAVHVDAPGELLVDMRVPAEEVAVSGRERASGSAPAVALPAWREQGSARIWRVRIPARRPPLRVIEVFARYRHGDGLFLAPLRMQD